MGRFFLSEWLREPGAQKMLIGKAEPFLRKGIDQLSTAIRPKKAYKTNRKDLDGNGLFSNLAYGFNYAPWTRPPKKGRGVDVHKAIGKLPKPQKGWTLPGHNYTGAQKMLIGKAEPFLRKGIDQLSTAIRPKKAYKTNRKDLDGSGLFSNLAYGFNYAPWTRPPKKGRGVDVHKAIGKLPKPQKGWTLPGHNYTGPYNPLDEQLRYDPQTGEILEFYQMPTGKTDAIAAQHDVDYSVCGNDRKCKNKADRKMVKSLDKVPWNERQYGHWLARNIIHTKQKLGLGLPKNGKRF